MYILVFIGVIGMVLGIFYFFLKKLFGEERFDEMSQESKESESCLKTDTTPEGKDSKDGQKVN